MGKYNTLQILNSGLRYQGMDQKMIEDHLCKIPVQIREVVQSLDTDEKWAVYIALLENERMSFSALRDLFEMNPSQITRILKALVLGGIVVKRAKSLRDVDDSARSYYELTRLGQDFYSATFDLVIPPRRSLPPVCHVTAPEGEQAVMSPVRSGSPILGGSRPARSPTIRGAARPELPSTVDV